MDPQEEYECLSAVPNAAALHISFVSLRVLGGKHQTHTQKHTHTHNHMGSVGGEGI